MARMSDQYEDIATELGISKTQAHNAAKRAFNKILVQLVECNKDMTFLDAVVELMKEYDLDPHSVKSMLNQKNKAHVAMELADNYKLLEHGVITQDRYDIILKAREK
jgi:hypothetical protein